MSGFPRTTAALRQALEERGVVPDKSKGQHFLTDVQAVDAIVRDAGVTAADRVVEVGTGPGVLTHALAETGAEVVTFDIDPEIQAVARSLRDWPSRVRFLVGDVLAGKHALSAEFRHEMGIRPAPPGRLLFVSNLPYGGGTPILLGVLALPRLPDDLVVMLQEEVVDKLLAHAGSTEYGAPSVAVGLLAEGKVLRRFGPEVFWPRPRVRSAVLRLVPRSPSPLPSEDARAFFEFVTTLFMFRRKVIASSLRLATPVLDGPRAVALLSETGIDPRLRVEAVPPERLLALWRAVRLVLRPASSAAGSGDDPRRPAPGDSNSDG